MVHAPAGKEDVSVKTGDEEANYEATDKRRTISDEVNCAAKEEVDYNDLIQEM